MKKLLTLFVTLLLASAAAAQSRWYIADGGNSIETRVTPADTPHYDHLEMSGQGVSCILRWGIDASQAFRHERTLLFPMLRTVPNNTHGTLLHCVAADIVSLLSVNGYPLTHETVGKVCFDGMLTVESVCQARQMATVKDLRKLKIPRIGVVRTFFPSPEKPAVCEIYEIKNLDGRPVTLCIPEFLQEFATDPAKGVDGNSYVVRGEITGSGTFELQPQQSVRFGAVFRAFRKAGEKPLAIDPDAEYKARRAFITDDTGAALVLETPDSVIDTEFRFAKIRGAESIYRTKGGPMHGPGGERFYAAIWANDQAEYINPFFPFLGYSLGNASALNSFRHFARFVNDEYRPIPSSVIAEGDGYWNGAGDRGDAAMIAYGAARYALARGDRAEAEELWKLIEWCLEYCRRRVNAAGVVASDSDELEGRFPAGDANLCTSTLYYDALVSAAFLGREIGIPGKRLAEYRRQAAVMKRNIERHFGARVGGYDTYRYFEGCELLRSWICIPLTAGIFDRAEQTVEALFGPELMTADGLLTQQGSNTFWDRSSLYALRGVFMAGCPDRAVDWLRAYSARRLLGEHVPYPVEAFPEGAQRHLSAENGLYCRIATEGLFGIRPTGLRSFDLTPQMPAAWDTMRLRHIRAFGSDFDIEVARTGPDRLRVGVIPAGGRTRSYDIRCGETVGIRL